MNFMRRPAKGARPRIARNQAWPAPTRGWIANDNIAIPQRDGARVLENWFVTAETIRVRGGRELFATIGNGSDRVTALFSYINGSNVKLFGTTPSAIYDITTVADAEVSPIADVSSLTGGDWISCQFQTDGGVFLRCVNGEDVSRVYDGAVWAADQAISSVEAGADISADFSFIWSWKQQLFFVEKESLNAWFLPVNQISGVASRLPLGGVFKRGGSLLYGASWSIDDNSGPNAACIFVTTEGEVAIYHGTDPSNAATWSLVGVSLIGKPLGKKAHIQAGGDLIIATDLGFLSLAQSISRSLAAISPSAASYPIETAWNERVARRAFAPWACEIFPASQMVLIALPSDAENRAEMLVANARTGAWSLFTNWDGNCLASFNDRIIFGSAEGEVFVGDITGADAGAPYTATCLWHSDAMRSPAARKIALQTRAIFKSQYQPAPVMFVNGDFDQSLPTAPSAPVIDAESLWGTALWGTDVWGSYEIEKSIFSDWYSVSGDGCYLAPGVRLTSGSVAPIRTELVSVDLTYDVGDIVT